MTPPPSRLMSIGTGLPLRCYCRKHRDTMMQGGSASGMCFAVADLRDGQELVHEDQRGPADAGEGAEAARAGARERSRPDQLGRGYCPLPSLVRSRSVQQRLRFILRTFARVGISFCPLHMSAANSICAQTGRQKCHFRPSHRLPGKHNLHDAQRALRIPKA